MVPIAYYLVLAAILFSVGVASFLIKRNIVTVFMSIELMLNAVNAEAAVGLAIIISIFRTRQTLNVDQVNLMKL